MRLIRRVVGEMIGAGAERKVRILYGGSVNSKNVQQYVELPLCDGALVGGASLDADEFAHIVNVTAKVYGHRQRELPQPLRPSAPPPLQWQHPPSRCRTRPR